MWSPICDLVELERIKTKKDEEDESDWEIPSFMNKEIRNERR